MLYVAIPLVFLMFWEVFGHYAKSKLNKIQSDFFKHDAKQQKLDLKNFKKYLFYAKLSRFMVDKMPWIVIGTILIIVANIFGLFIILFALWFKRSLSDTNYRGYNKYQNGKKAHLRALDEWVVVANQTIMSNES